MLPLLEIVTTTSSTELGVWEFWESTAQTLITGEHKKAQIYTLILIVITNNYTEKKKRGD